MLDLVLAARFDKPMGNGKTRPCLIACLDNQEEEIELIVKFSAGCDMKEGGLAAEAIGAMLATDLGLPVPEPFLVSVDPDFIETVQNDEIKALMRASACIAYGSRKLPAGFSTLPLGHQIPDALQIQASEIFAFDALTLNYDRRPSNPNCLYDGKNYAIYDHELIVIKLLFALDPWQPGALEGLKGQPTSHIFFEQLHRVNAELLGFKEAWENLTDARLSEYKGALPVEWAKGSNRADEILLHIRNVRDNIESGLKEVQRVLL